MEVLFFGLKWSPIHNRYCACGSLDCINYGQNFWLIEQQQFWHNNHKAIPRVLWGVQTHTFSFILKVVLFYQDYIHLCRRFNIPWLFFSQCSGWRCWKAIVSISVLKSRISMQGLILQNAKCPQFPLTLEEDGGIQIDFNIAIDKYI